MLCDVCLRSLPFLSVLFSSFRSSKECPVASAGRARRYCVESPPIHCDGSKSYVKDTAVKERKEHSKQNACQLFTVGIHAQSLGASPDWLFQIKWASACGTGPGSIESRRHFGVGKVGYSLSIAVGETIVPSSLSRNDKEWQHWMKRSNHNGLISPRSTQVDY